MEAKAPAAAPVPKGEARAGTRKDSPPSSRDLSRADLLAMANGLRRFMREYHSLLARHRAGQPLEAPQLALVRRHQALVAEPESPGRALAWLVALLGHLLERLPQRALSFHIPTSGGMLPEETSAELDDLAGAYTELQPALTRYVEATAVATPALRDVTAQQVEAVLPVIQALFKGVIRQDWDDVDLFMNHLNLVTTSHDNEALVNRVARMAREIYNSLNSFSSDFTLAPLSKSASELPDAVETLNGVITRLEQSVNTTLDTLEGLNAQAMEHKTWVVAGLQDVESLDAELDRVTQSHPELSEALEPVRRALREEVQPGLTDLGDRLDANAAAFMTLIGNQSFQDLSGQTLKKVITFIERLQMQLLQLITNNAPAAPTEQAGQAEEVPLHGPDGGAQLNQAAVDTLLADLGF